MKNKRRIQLPFNSGIRASECYTNIYLIEILSVKLMATDHNRAFLLFSKGTFSINSIFCMNPHNMSYTDKFLSFSGFAYCLKIALWFLLENYSQILNTALNSADNIISGGLHRNLVWACMHFCKGKYWRIESLALDLLFRLNLDTNQKQTLTRVVWLWYLETHCKKTP